MDCSYEYLTVHAMTGETTAVDQTHVLHEETRLTVLISKDLRSILAPFARHMAVRETFMSGGAPAGRAELEALTEKFIGSKVSAHQGTTFLACLFRGESKLGNTALLKDYAGDLQIVDVDRRPYVPQMDNTKPPDLVNEVHLAELSAVVVSVAAEMRASAKHLLTSVRYTKDATEVLPIHFSSGNARGVVSRRPSAQEINQVGAAVRAAIGSPELASVAEFFLEAFQQRSGLLPFYLSWTAIERFVQDVFSSQGLSAPPEPLSPKVSIRTKAALVSELALPDRDSASQWQRDFSDLNRQRNKLFHGGGSSRAVLPVETAQDVFLQLVRGHNRLNRTGQGVP